MDSETLKNFNFKLINGRFAENKNELVISNHIKGNGGVEFKIGDKVKLNVGTRMSDGFELKGSNPYYEEIGEEIVNSKEYEFTIVRNNRKTSAIVLNHIQTQDILL